MEKSLVEQYTDERIGSRLYQQERAIYEVTELIESVMTEKGISRSALANLLGKDKSWVTQFLDGEANKTIRTVADALAVLGCQFRSFAEPIKVVREGLPDDGDFVKAQWASQREWRPFGVVGTPASGAA